MIKQNLVKTKFIYQLSIEYVVYMCAQAFIANLKLGRKDKPEGVYRMSMVLRRES